MLQKNLEEELKSIYIANNYINYQYTITEDNEYT